MSSSFDDSHLTTAGGIKYKFLGMSGGFEFDEGRITWRALIQTVDLVSFLTELFPPPLAFGNLLIPTSATMPGLPTMMAKRVRFKSQDGGMPIDPFSADTFLSSENHSKTYYPTIEVEVEFAPGPRTSPDPTDPFTFLEISANATGEFINSHMPTAKWDHSEGTETIDGNTGEVTEDSNPTTSTDEVRSPQIPVIVKVPQTEWTLRWPQIRFEFFQDVMIHRLRILMGRVNSNTIPVLFDASPETCLFVGYTLKQNYTWREDTYEVGKPPVTVEMKIREKRVVWKGKIRGHNDVWRPGFGWDRLLIDGTNPSYESIDYGILFRV